MASPSEMIGWECGACSYSNNDCMRRNWPMCMTERPKRYFIVPGASVLATARMMTVDRREQARLVALRNAVVDAFPPAPVDKEPIVDALRDAVEDAPPPVDKEPIADC